MKSSIFILGKRETMNYKMVIQYDGSRYKGFQKQTGKDENDSTIQGKLENVLKTFLGYETFIVGCGRTDAGVHAENYIANFNTKTKIDIANLISHFDEFLPEDIYVKEINKAGDRFHARYNAESKTYQYRIATPRNRDVFTRKQAFLFNETLDIEKMNQASEYLIGERDFAGFTNLKSKKKSTVRIINSINIYQENYKDICIDIEGNGFLQNMVRIIAGTLIEVGSGKREISSINKVLENKIREEAGFMAPPQGLKLLKVKY